MYVVRKWRGSPTRGRWVYFDRYEDGIPVFQLTLDRATKYPSKTYAQAAADVVGGKVHAPYSRSKEGNS